MLLKTLGGLRLQGARFTRPKPLLLLAFLALEGHQPLRRVRELFWHDAANPRQSLNIAVTRLRQAAARIVRVKDGHISTQLDTDAQRFLSLVEAGGFAAAAALYDGQFLEGIYVRGLSVELEEWVLQTRDYLAGAAGQTYLRLAEQRAAAGDFVQSAQFAEQSFRVADSVHDPGTLARLHTLMIAGNSPSASKASDEAQYFGVQLLSNSTEARERLLQELASGPVAETRHNIPSVQKRFLGRSSELAQVATVLARPDCQLLTLLGPPGVGKSRLAVQAAHEQRVSRGFPDGIFIVPLESAESSDGVLPAVAKAVGLDLRPEDDAVAQLVAHLSESRMLIVLDNLEHVIDVAPKLAALINRCRKLKLLATSRVRVDADVECAIAIEGLPLPETTELSPQQALRYDAIHLFALLAQRARPDFELDDRDVRHIIELCRLLGGLPLAIELAAAWTRVLTTEELVRELSSNMALFASPTRDAAARHRSLEGAFEHSWRLLKAPEQRGLATASVFIGGFGAEAAGEVANASIATLRSLASSSLLREAAPGRFEFHPLLRQFARNKLEDGAGELEAALNRHAHYYLGLLRNAEHAIAGGAEQSSAIARLEAEHANIRAAWRNAAANTRVELLWLACRPLQLLYNQRGGMAAEAAELFADAAETLHAADLKHPALTGRLCAAAGWFFALCADYGRSNQLVERGLALLRPLVVSDREHNAAEPDLGDGVDIAVSRAYMSSLNTLGLTARWQGRYAAARRHFTDALEYATRVDNSAQIAIITNNLAALEKDAGQYQESAALYATALALNRRLGNHRSVVRNLVNWGALATLADEPERAESMLHEARQLAEDIGYTSILPDVLINQAGAAFKLGHHAKARSLYLEALVRNEEDEQPGFAANIHASLARIALTRGEMVEAAQRLHVAFKLTRSMRHAGVLHDVVIGLAELRLKSGDLDAAARLIRATLSRKDLTHAARMRATAAADALRALLPAEAIADHPRDAEVPDAEALLRELMDDFPGDVRAPS